jgi:hypothetical protein
MNKRTKRIGFPLAALALVGGSVYAFTRPTDVAGVVPVRLEITGPVGQRFSGTYTADGATNTVTATAPATIGVAGTDVTYEFKPEGAAPAAGGGEFRVNLYVGDVQRLSTVADGKGVRGAYRLTSTRTGGGIASLTSTNESYWAGGLRTPANRAATPVAPAPHNPK